MMRRLRFAWHASTNTLNKWIADDIPMHGAALAFYTIFSLAPILIIIIGVIGWAWGDQAGLYQVRQVMRDYLDPSLTRTLLGIVEQTTQTGGMATSIVGIGTLLFASTTAVAQLKSTLNLIWKVKIMEGKGLLQFLLDRGISLVMVFSLTLLLMLSVISDGILYAIAPHIESILPFDLDLAAYLNQILLWVSTTVLFAVIFKMLPDVSLRWRDVFVGALITTLLFMLGKLVIGWYLRNYGSADAFGAAGTFVVFLIWVYYNAQVVFFGAEFTQVYMAMKGRPMTPKRFAYFEEPG